MGLIKKFKKAAHDYLFQFAPEDNPAPVLSDATPAMLGDLGTIEEFNEMLKAASTDLTTKSKAYSAIKNHTSNKSSDAYHAFSDASDNVNYIKKDFVSGAMDGFTFNRIKNIQAIMAAPENFRQPEDTSGQSFAVDTLIDLLKRSNDPDKVPALALAKATPRNKQLIVNGAFIKLGAEPQDEKTAAAITALKKANAGAPAPDENAQPTIRKQHAPKKIVLSPVHRFGKE